MKITELFERGEFAISAEVGPPKGIHIDHLVEEAKEYLKKVGRLDALKCPVQLRNYATDDEVSK